MSTGIFLKTAEEISQGVRSQEFSALSVAECFLQRIEKYQTQVNAFTLVTKERALKEAKAVDTLVANGKDPGPLAGVPYAVKNLFNLAGEVTLAGSKINAAYAPAKEDCTAVERLKKSGAVCLGASNMGEYAYDFITANAHYGSTFNPHDLKRSAGGSSGGSAACIAARLSTFTLGTDTNGSIRVPSSFCGIWGLKPTYGRLSRHGGFLFSESLDTIGVFGHSVKDLSLCYDAISGADDKDPVCYPAEPENTAPTINQGIEGLRVAGLTGYFSTKGLESIDEAYQRVFEALGGSSNIELPFTELARSSAYVITNCEGAQLHLDRLKHKAADFDPRMRARFLAGALNPAAWYIKAQKFRRWWQQEVKKVFSSVDILIAPATPMVAPPLDQELFMFRDKELELRPNIGIFTQPITLIGLPVLTVPVHIPGKLPTAIQLIGKPYSEEHLLRAARSLEKMGICSAPLAKGFNQTTTHSAD